MHYIYLHGFASSPKSSKAQYLRDRFAEKNLYLNILDLNQGDFSNLTLSRQIEQTIAAFPDSHSPITLIGSSFGALTSAWVAQKCDRVKGLILLAPAFGFPQSWYSRLEPNQIEQWQKTGFLPIYHYGEDKQIPLKYQFLEDAENYPIEELKRNLPTLIIHGINDDVVPIQVSRDYVDRHSQVRLIELDSDHGLNDSQATIWQEIARLIDFREPTI
ncbi:alpha/beta fold hydrolase [Waterburya agarophytonicola K14]|uniref:Alpha/beta fold hydrolase n=1 Tax=Waterburya agarophytonicola KI4 TaxID=2874699 RepID=A0A964BTY2_9CYAN|nr:YqiA/YcfP family alpha/beta fold hydrolase [Waterburya agarophytonicola]MCC0179764.1 alpha/beta fold hydrolase [Waterburya agarophytonicola KI4]